MADYTSTHLIAPSFLSANFADLKSDIQMINESDADWFHLDIMDGVFVPNITFGFPIVSVIRKYTEKPIDVHLMIAEPDKYISRFKEAGANILTVHYEACTHLHRTVCAIKEQGMRAGVALNPHTPIQVLEDILYEVDMVLIMSVNPGFGGQKFIENTFKKVKALRKIIFGKQLKTLIEVDGGVDFTNARALVNTGTDVLVTGSTIFKAENPKKAITSLKYLYQQSLF